ncbi:acyl-CoA dehydrogenase N-terminal domain-containing protein, partial [Brevundimonas naejangsanensis]
MAYKAPVRDLSFILHDVLQVESYGNQLPEADLSRDLIDQIVEEGGKFAEEVIAPINR